MNYLIVRYGVVWGYINIYPTILTNPVLIGCMRFYVLLRFCDSGL